MSRKSFRDENSLRVLGGAIRFCRNYMGLTRTEVAKRAGMSVAYISLLECGKRDISWSALCCVARALGLSPMALVFFSLPKEELEVLGPDVVGRFMLQVTK